MFEPQDFLWGRGVTPLPPLHPIMLHTCMHECDMPKGPGTSLIGSKQRWRFEKKFLVEIFIYTAIMANSSSNKGKWTH